jgi:tetratricopeptide (TPR) repeat protein
MVPTRHPRCHRLVLLCVLTTVAVACRGGSLEDRVLAAYDPARTVGGTEVAYPRPGTVFPPDAAPPLVRWTDKSAAGTGWLVLVDLPGEASRVTAVVRTPEWRPSEAQWRQVLAGGRSGPLALTVLGFDESDGKTQIRSAGHTTLLVSTDPVAASLFYREVELPFLQAVKNPERLRWRFGSPSARTPPPIVLTGLPVCGNCHSFSADGKTMGMDIDYANDKGSYALLPTAPQMALSLDRIFSWSQFKFDANEPTFGLLSQVSPDGRYVVSTVKDRSVFIPRPDLAFSQLFFPVKGILVVWDRETRQFASVPGADDPAFVQSNASWSPDGRTILFARAKAHDLHVTHDKAILGEADASEFTTGGKKFRFDLYTVPFNGGKGGTATPLAGAANNGFSNYFGRYSPDGKWIVFTRSDSFMLLQPDSRLFIVPASGGKERLMACNTVRMNSWHTWSPNSRWLVFSSKANGPYTQLYLTHVDANGQDAPAVLLEHLTEPNHAANIPELVPLPPLAIQNIRNEFTDDYSYLRAGAQDMEVGDHASAIRKLLKAVEINPTNANAHATLAAALASAERYPEAIPHFRESLRLNPDQPSVGVDLAHALWSAGEAKEAARLFGIAVVQIPGDASLRDDYGRLLLELRQPTQAIAQLAEAVKLDAADPDRRLGFAQVLSALGEYDEAAVQAEKALTLRPGWAQAQATLVAIRSLRDAAKTAPTR